MKETIPLSQKQQLRQQLRSRRKRLSNKEQAHAAYGLCNQLLTLPEFQRAKRIAVYFASDGEIDLQPLIAQCWKYGKHTYLPVLHPISQRRLVFMPFRPGVELARNRYGIPEPLSHLSRPAPTWTLDLVLTPLVGFDAQGNRMGMGGGYYDKSFEFLKHNRHPRKPKMIGVAHECQKVERLETERWDIKMDMIVTGSRVYRI